MRRVIITTTHIAELYGDRFNDPIITFPSGEEHKTRKTKEEIEDKLLEQGYGRDTHIIALGGGVVSDIVGFVAATFCRGVPFTIIPTTLLSMVDASIGGKTGVNTPHGKNLIGAFYPPQEVILDLKYLNTLPQKELQNGFVEMIKHGLIYDQDYFFFLYDNAEKLLSLDERLLTQAIQRSIEIKKEIVALDFKEKGIRTLLNFGHTVGHALELTSNYTLTHGEAVALGILAEGYLSEHLTRFPSILALKDILIKYNLPLSVTSVVQIDHMSRDKKSLNQTPRFVLLEKIGRAAHFDGNYCSSAEPSLINKALSTIKRSASMSLASSK